jgi:predicted O-linked N-acetylglucosamine transferase (SPINDLY family)
MGVPVVTFTGDRFCGRHSASHIRNVGLGELVASDLDGYLKMATDLAGNVSRLAEIRSTLREKCLGSSLFDAERFHKSFTAALREMWTGKSDYGAARKK